MSFKTQLALTLSLSFAPLAFAASAPAITTWHDAELVAVSAYRDYKFTEVRAECVSFLQNEETPTAFIFELRELHSPTCGGDPQFAPRLMALGVNKADASLLSDRNDELDLRPVPTPICSVLSSAPATDVTYPVYTVTLNNKVIYSPQSDGVTKVVKSRSGRKILLTAGEMNLLDIAAGKFEYGAVVVNCVTGSIQGYLKDTPALATDFWNTELGFKAVAGDPMKSVSVEL